jgi:hypothetical protein
MNADQQWNSPQEALRACLKEPDPIEALKQVVCANIDYDEIGFARELLEEWDGSPWPRIPSYRITPGTTGMGWVTVEKWEGSLGRYAPLTSFRDRGQAERFINQATNTERE